MSSLFQQVIPEEIVALIVSFLSPTWIIRLAQTNSHMHKLLMSVDGKKRRRRSKAHDDSPSNQSNESQSDHVSMNHESDHVAMSAHIWRGVYEQIRRLHNDPIIINNGVTTMTSTTTTMSGDSGHDENDEDEPMMQKSPLPPPPPYPPSSSSSSSLSPFDALCSTPSSSSLPQQQQPLSPVVGIVVVNHNNTSSHNHQNCQYWIDQCKQYLSLQFSMPMHYRECSTVNSGEDEKEQQEKEQQEKEEQRQGENDGKKLMIHHDYRNSYTISGLARGHTTSTLSFKNKNRSIESDHDSFWHIVRVRRPLHYRWFTHDEYRFEGMTSCCCCWEVVLDRFQSDLNYISVVVGVTSNREGERSEVVGILGNSSGEIGFSAGNLGFYAHGGFLQSEHSRGELAFPRNEYRLKSGDAIGVKVEPVSNMDHKYGEVNACNFRWFLSFYVNGRPVVEKKDKWDLEEQLTSRIITGHTIWPAVSLIHSQTISIRKVKQLPYVCQQ